MIMGLYLWISLFPKSVFPFTRLALIDSIRTLHTQSPVHELHKLQLPINKKLPRSAQLHPSIAFLIANTFQTRQMTIYYELLLLCGQSQKYRAEIVSFL